MQERVTGKTNDMEQLLKKKRIYQLNPPPETIEGWNKQLDVLRTKWGKYFKDEEQFEYFVMLPLSDEQRWVVLRAAAEERRFELELESCTGKMDSTPEHRQRCIPCCLVNRKKNML